MSEFDKEAEREKLREQYDRDRRKREATQRMSDLLLRGATMTNRHCRNCGDPIFRYEGQEFCPTCESGTSTADADGTPDDGETAPSTPDADASTEASDVEPETSEPESDGRSPGTERGEGSPDRVEPGTPVRPVDVTGDPASAVAALLETIERLARRAGSADDPRQAKEYLEAASLAAETIERLDGR